MKVCRACGEAKDLSAFYKHKRMADGHLNRCKACRNSYVNSWVEKNRARRREISRESAARNRTPEKSAQSWRRWYSQARLDTTKVAAIASRNSARRALEKRATPRWADKRALLDVYVRCRALNDSEVSDDRFEVDHVVPLNSPLVCGLHVAENLQILRKSENCRKKNRFVSV